MANKGFKFGRASRRNLNECHPLLQEIFDEVIKIMDCSILEGYRNRSNQNKAYRKKKSKLKYPQSKHNRKPSLAVDVAPYPIGWQDRERFCLLAGVVKGIAHSKGIEIRWGGDFNSNNIISDESFVDMPHFELIGVK